MTVLLIAYPGYMYHILSTCIYITSKNYLYK
nr:MAG TPA: hypothetical protein [Caudoviricetes sp.]